MGSVPAPLGRKAVRQLVADCQEKQTLHRTLPLAGLALIADLGDRAIIQMDPVKTRVALLAANPPDTPEKRTMSRPHKSGP